VIYGVIAGLDPAIIVFAGEGCPGRARSDDKGWRDEPGHDERENEVRKSIRVAILLKSVSEPEPKIGNVIITKFMNSIMYDGRKSPRGHRLWRVDLDEARPSRAAAVFGRRSKTSCRHRVRSRRVGGATYRCGGSALDRRRRSASAG